MLEWVSFAYSTFIIVENFSTLSDELHVYKELKFSILNIYCAFVKSQEYSSTEKFTEFII